MSVRAVSISSVASFVFFHARPSALGDVVPSWLAENGVILANGGTPVLHFTLNQHNELHQIEREVKALVKPHAYRLLLASKFTGLQATAPAPEVRRGFTIAAYDPSRYNIAPVSAGTLGTKVTAGNATYQLGCNHVLAANGRVTKDAPRSEG